MTQPVCCFLLKPSVMCWSSLAMWSWQLMFFLKPDWHGGNMLFSSAQIRIREFTIFSNSLLMQLIRDIGL